MLKSTSYDYVICGAGCAGLSLLMRMVDSGQFRDKKILLIDKEQKKRNDRTWCFWEKEQGFFDQVVYKSWENISFLSKDFSSSYSIAPYRYKMIRAIDFYNYCFDVIVRQPNIEVVYGQLSKIEAADHRFHLAIDGRDIDIAANAVFSSIMNEPLSGKKAIRLMQHFKGWLIETPGQAFNAANATLMDFRVEQPRPNGGTSFGYVLPLDDRCALVEYTLFSETVWEQKEYDRELDYYIRRLLGISDFIIRDEEFGVIPMTTDHFGFFKEGVYHIGIAGGQAKGSSGYTYQFIQKQSCQIVDQLIAGKSLANLRFSPRRFKFYDDTLLYILYHHKVAGEKIFTRLFQKNDIHRLLRFLDNESSLADDLGIISTLPTLPFLKAALHQL